MREHLSREREIQTGGRCRSVIPYTKTAKVPVPNGRKWEMEKTKGRDTERAVDVVSAGRGRGESALESSRTRQTATPCFIATPRPYSRPDKRPCSAGKCGEAGGWLASESGVVGLRLGSCENQPHTVGP